MEITLHIGAHRTGTTSLQVYLQSNHKRLAQDGVMYWGPKVTRSDLFDGLVRDLDRLDDIFQLRGYRASAGIKHSLQALEDDDVKVLFVSEENMIGEMWENVLRGQLYPDAGARLKRFVPAFGARCTRIAISVRSYDSYWASVLAYLVCNRKQPLPSGALVQKLANQTRGWREIVTEVARNFPKAQVQVTPFEDNIEELEAMIERMIGAAISCEMVPLNGVHNASLDTAKLRQLLVERGATDQAALLPDTTQRWQPFTEQQIAAQRARYTDDIEWLRSGADGLASCV